MLLSNQNKSQLFSEILTVFHGPEISSEICFQKFHQKFVLQSVIFLGGHQKRLQNLEPTKFGATNIFRPVTPRRE